ncbi:MAG: hypothetical protein ABJA98_00265 [Acidobacteriota bacterium]
MSFAGSKAVNVGEFLVVAEVLKDQGGWLDLLVHACTVTSEKPGHKILPLASGPLTRKRHTVEKGRPERLLGAMRPRALPW